MAWDESEKAAWFAAQTVIRLYADEVIAKIETLQDDFQVDRYGEYYGYFEWWRYWLLLLFQIAAVVVFAEFARDAIRRRKWGAGNV